MPGCGCEAAPRHNPVHNRGNSRGAVRLADEKTGDAFGESRLAGSVESVKDARSVLAKLDSVSFNDKPASEFKIGNGGDHRTAQVAATSSAGKPRGGQ